MIQFLQTNYLEVHEPRAAACCKRKQRNVIFWCVSPSTSKGSQALSAHNLFLFFPCFDVISCFPRQELVRSGGEMDKSGCATFDIEVRSLCSLQADTH